MMSTSTFKRELTDILTQRFGQALSQKDIDQLDLKIKISASLSYPVQLVVDHLVRLRRISNRTLLTIFSECNDLPCSQSEAIMRSFPVYRTGMPCSYHHVSLRSTHSRRCLACIDESLAQTRLLKAIKIVQSALDHHPGIDKGIQHIQALSPVQKTHLLDLYLAQPDRANDFYHKAKKANLLT